MSRPLFPHDLWHHSPDAPASDATLQQALGAIHEAIVWSAELQAAAVLRAGGYSDDSVGVLSDLIEQVGS